MSEIAGTLSVLSKVVIVNVTAAASKKFDANNTYSNYTPTARMHSTITVSMRDSQATVVWTISWRVDKHTEVQKWGLIPEISANAAGVG